MNAIILAAGDATRFTPSLSKPKCLIEIGGASMLSRQLRLLGEAGIHRVSIVVGHLAAEIENEVRGGQHGCSIQLVRNPDYQRGSALSLLRGMESVGEEPVLILDADVIFAADVLNAVLKERAANCLPVDEQFEDTGEEVKAVALEDRRVEALGKSVAPIKGRIVGESVGIFKLDATGSKVLHESLMSAVSGDPDIEYESVMNSILGELAMYYVRVTGLPWIEIDFVHDLVRAEKVVWPRIAALEVERA
jgi:choline kinase